MESVLTFLAIIAFGFVLIVFVIYCGAILKLGIIDPIVNIFRALFGLKRS